MAKQLGIIQFKGKLGEIVGAKRSAGQKSNTLRVRVREIANPKTTGQIQQRMRLLPAVNFYRMLQNVLNHAFQGTQYKAPSYHEFMRLALKNDDFPYVVKGETLPIPGAYQISKGSLPSVLVRSVDDNNATFALGWSEDWDENAPTIGAISQSWINNNGLQEGDQLTFILASQDDGSVYGSQIIYQTAVFIVNTQSTVGIGEWEAANKLTVGDNDGLFRISRSEATGEWYPCAAAVIVSRPPSTAGGAWLRSNATMFVKPSVLLETRSTQAYQAAFDSYGVGEQLLSSDWYLNQSRARYKAATSYLYSAAYQQNNTKPFMPNVLFLNDAGTSKLVISQLPQGDTLYIFDGTEARVTTVTLTGSVANTITLAEVQSRFPDLVVNTDPYTPPVEEGGGEVPQP